MKKIFYTAFYFCSALLLSSCIGDLDQYPHEDETAASIYTSAANYKADRKSTRLNSSHSSQSRMPSSA